MCIASCFFCCTAESACHIVRRHQDVVDLAEIKQRYTHPHNTCNTYNLARDYEKEWPQANKSLEQLREELAGRWCSSRAKHSSRIVQM
jgi:hypothetical protein